jgi:hypothetical protein
VVVQDVAVGKDDLIDGMLATDRFQRLFVNYRNPVRVMRTRKLDRIAAAGDTGNLGCRECSDLDGRIIPVHYIEVVKVAASGTNDDNAATMAVSVLWPALHVLQSGFVSTLHMHVPHPSR